jgi:hypothetical protein
MYQHVTDITDCELDTIFCPHGCICLSFFDQGVLPCGRMGYRKQSVSAFVFQMLDGWKRLACFQIEIVSLINRRL